MKRLLFLLPVLMIIAVGCDDAVTDSISTDSSERVVSSDALNEAAFGKNNGNGKGNDKGGGKPGGGGKDAFPTYSDIKVSTLNLSEELDWFDGSIMEVPSIVNSYEDGLTPDAFFGCPDLTRPCYEITITLDQADSGDAVAVRIFPFEEDVRCTTGPCPEDPSLDDGTTNPPRRALSLFDDYLGTPYVPVEEFTDGTYSFYWQGQALRTYFDPNTSERLAAGYYRADRDPDDGGADLLRAAASFIDASSPGTVDGVSLSEIDYCASSSPVANDNEGCVFRFYGAPTAGSAIGVSFSGIGETTQGRGRNKSVTTEILVDHSLDGQSQVRPDGGSDVWVVYLIENVLTNGSAIRTVESTSNNSLSVSPQEGCLMIRPLQAELFANSTSEFYSSFSADQSGFEEYFRAGSDGSLSADESCSNSF